MQLKSSINSNKKYNKPASKVYFPLKLALYILDLESISAFANWSGHEVPLPLQSMPVSLEIARSMSIPLTNDEIPCRFPLHPPTKITSLILLSSISNLISLEQVPEVL